ncbi:MAG: hypothetical protein V4663_01860 [Bacteroidota bacterium]
METKNENKSLLNEFTKELENVSDLLIVALNNNSNDEDEKNIINSIAPTLKTQFLELSNSIQSFNKRLTKQGSADVEQLLKSSAALDITKSFKMALPSIGSLFGKLGLQEIILAIKKIIIAIFGDKLPPWLHNVLNIIDEIINTLIGGDSPKTKNILSMAEQNFLKEITLVAKLNQVSFQKNNDEDDE